MKIPLHAYYRNGICEAGVDEAGRGCLAGPVFAAAVILRPDLPADLRLNLNDSKKLSEKQRNLLRAQIESHALSYAIGMADNEEIDRINILNASFLAMHRAIEKLNPIPELVIIDGNRFKPLKDIEHFCIIKGDGLYLSIAAASILAKTYRDDYMMKAHEQFPVYQWSRNKGYPTLIHREAIINYGFSPIHRKSFKCAIQTKLLL